VNPHKLDKVLTELRDKNLNLRREMSEHGLNYTLYIFREKHKVILGFEKNTGKQLVRNEEIKLYEKDPKNLIIKFPDQDTLKRAVLAVASDVINFKENTLDHSIKFRNRNDYNSAMVNLQIAGIQTLNEETCDPSDPLCIHGPGADNWVDEITRKKKGPFDNYALNVYPDEATGGIENGFQQPYLPKAWADIPTELNKMRKHAGVGINNPTYKSGVNAPGGFGE
jgi:hypothetical protein